jgi:MFS family permease
VTSPFLTVGVPKLARLCALNFGIQLVWGAVLSISLQSRSIEVAGQNALSIYAGLASIGAALATVVQILVGSRSDERRQRAGGRRAFSAFAVAIAVTTLGWFYLAPTLLQLVVSYLVLQIAMNVVATPFQAVIADLVTKGRQGAASSWMAAYQGLGNAAGLLLAGFTRDERWVAAWLGVPLVASWATTVRAVRRMRRPPSASTAPFSAYRAFGALLLARGAVNIGYFTIIGLMVFYVRESLTQTGPVQRQTSLVLLTLLLAAVVGAALAAHSADRYDKRLVWCVGNGVTIAALLMLSVLHEPEFVRVASGIVGIGLGIFVTADWALASGMASTGSSATAMAFWNAATTVPQIVAPILALPVVQRFDRIHVGLGPRAAFVLAVLEFTLGAALVWRIPRSTSARAA